MSIASVRRLARSVAAARSSDSVAKVCIALTSSCSALIAVLKWKSSMSVVTRWIVSWTVRRNARPGVDSSAFGAGAATNVPRFAWKSRHTRLRKRKAPSTPWSLHSRSFSGGAMKSSNTRPVSAPYVTMKSSGLTTLPLDFDILAPSLTTIPCVNSRWNGSSSLK